MTRRRPHRFPGLRAAATALLALAPLATMLVPAGEAGAASAAEPPARLALTGARIIPVVGEEIASGTVLIEHGRITAVGEDVDVPYDAMEIDLAGKVVFPGMIHPHSPDGLDVANETLPVAPFLDVYDAIDPSRSFFENALRDGITTVHVMQGNNTVIGGVSRAVRPIGLSVDEMTVASDVALKMATSPRGGYGRMRQMAELREAFRGLADYRERRDVLVAGLREVGFRVEPPGGTYFVLADHTPFGFADDWSFCRHLVTEVGVAAIPPSAFHRTEGGGRHLARFAFCKDLPTIEAAVERLRAGLTPSA